MIIDRGVKTDRLPQSRLHLSPEDAMLSIRNTSLTVMDSTLLWSNTSNLDICGV
jgi:hypothetical protein